MIKTSYIKKKVGEYYYDINDFLGHGTNSQVFKGYSVNSESLAIKQIPIPQFPEKEKQKFDNFMNYLGREIEIMKKLSHDNILKLIDCRCTSNNFYLITEFCNGGDLKSIKFDLIYEQILTILKQIVNAMIYANSLKIMHRDLKPQNILIHNKVIKIGDLGYARIFVDGEDDNLKMDLKITPQIGTPLYMAPEVFYSGKYCDKCDGWSMGIILYELLFKKHPWKEENVKMNEFQLFEKINMIPLDFPSKNNVDILMIDLITRMLQKDEKKRMNWKEVADHEILQQKIPDFL